MPWVLVLVLMLMSPENALAKAKSFSGLQGVDLALEVSRQTIERWHEGQGEWGMSSQASSISCGCL